MAKFILLIISLSISLFSHSQQPTVDTEPDKIRFCFSRWWPYNFSEQGVVKGLQIDILRSAMKDSGVSLEFSELPFKRCKDSVRLGKYDFILDIDTSDDLDIVKYSISSWQLSFAVEHDAGVNSLSDIKSLKEFRVVMAEEYIYPDIVYDKLSKLNAITARVSYYESSDEDAKALFGILKNAQVEALLVDRYWAKQVVRKYNLPVLIFDEPLHVEPQFIGYVAKYAKHKASLLEQNLNLLSTEKIESIRKMYR
ncbi:hypothetical protein PA25_16780 [Pseudoalteromonas sp. A25]|uniref:substrate-binding periplasmic protein n=1 Tax=Pseudoalteromonas sp. A25 TaxID=116092 RepID=UPI0012610406|nr:transporter substrate-binding domain-containing protein [Pseudoalteromonas sp. A25]BBN81693.1 hypothetical protein PA25_16780 [Pseudoalteromonas sp. A25]